MAGGRAPGATSTTGTTSVAAIASAARSARRGSPRRRRRRGRPDGEAGLGEHARHRRQQAQLGRLVAQAPAEQAQRLQDEVVERPAGEGHAAAERGGAGGVEPELALLHPHGGGEARVHLGEAELVQRPADVARGGPAEHPHGRPLLPGGAGPSGSPPPRSAGPRGGRASGRPGRRPARARSAEQISSAEAWLTVHWLECHRL